MATIYNLDGTFGDKGGFCDVFLPGKNGRFVGLITKSPKGTFRHYYNGEATKGSSKAFPTIEAAIASIDARRARLAAKRAARN